MLTAEARRRLTVVLVGARNPQNIGAAARAMQDFGFSDLRVVNEFAPPFEAAQLEAKSAVGAAEIMRSARLFSSLPQAIADCSLIAGTTAIGDRDLRLSVQTLQEAAPKLVASLSPAPFESPSHRDARLSGLQVAESPLANSQLATSQPTGSPPTDSPLTDSKLTAEQDLPFSDKPSVALLFGSEKTGLTKDQLSHCSLLLTIPLFSPEGRHLSMNLGQSVAVCLYELSRGGFEGIRGLPIQGSVPSTSADRERLTALLQNVMDTTGYTRRFPANARPEVIRQLSASLGQTREEAATWMGLPKHLQQPKP